MLTRIYNALQQQGRPFEVVFVSADEDEEAFRSYASEMPWKCLPFADQDRAENLNTRLGVSGIPTLALFDESGQRQCADALQFILDEGAEGFPWENAEDEQDEQDEEDSEEEEEEEEEDDDDDDDDYEFSFADLGPVLVHRDGRHVTPTEALKDRVVVLYWSAHWCPPCRTTTPRLVTIYEECRAAGKPFEIVFISWDSDQAAYTKYLEGMPWWALPFDDVERQERLTKLFKVRGIPQCILFDAQGTIRLCTLLSLHAL